MWWFSTGLILVFVQRADRAARAEAAHFRLTLLGLPFLALGWLGLANSFETPDLLGVYAGFLSAILIWGWFELAFLCGVLTGPNRRVCPPGVPAWERFLRAWGTIAYSEMGLIATMIAIASFGFEASNPVGAWTFTVLFLARISAKLNLYLGVPEVNEEFLPGPMRHLPSHFRKARMNAFFPISIALLTLATGCWVERLLAQPEGAPAAIGFALLAALTALALLEHWLMVLPVADAKLWRWLLPHPQQDGARSGATNAAATRENTHGL